MSLDEQATVATLDAARRVFAAQVQAWHGRVVDMAGDSVLAVFDAPAGAAGAALAIQEELAAADAQLAEDRRMQFRIGIHMGDVIEKADGTVCGDGVNIAARPQALAEPGGITVSDAVRGAVRGKVAARFDDQGEQTVKNIAEPLRVFAMRAEGSASAPATRPRESVNTIELVAARQAVDRGAALRQHVGRPAAGVLHRRHHRGHHDRAVALSTRSS